MTEMTQQQGDGDTNTWEVHDENGRQRGGMSRTEAQELVDLNASPSFFARNTEDGEEIRYSAK